MIPVPAGVRVWLATAHPRHVFAGARVHGDDTPVPVRAKGKTRDRAGPLVRQHS